MAKNKNTNEHPVQGVLPSVNAEATPPVESQLIELGTLTSQPVVERDAIQETLPDGTIRVDY